jgi:2-amino-4-hydroxy-6-hydroxymethyldihydropteridine diphosphokinase
LQRAIASLADQPDVRVVGVSDVYETDPVGGPEQDDFLNLVVELDASLDARGLLTLAQVLEERAQRVRLERWGPRTLDVDVLWVEGELVDDPDLVVPHPRMWQRRFVLAPLAELAPDLVTEELLESAEGEVRRLGPL